MENNFIQSIGQRVHLHGAIHKIRRMKGFAFVLLRTAREVLQCVYVENEAGFPLEKLVEESAVRLHCLVKEDARSRQGVEFLIRAVEILSLPAEEMPVVINQRQVMASLNTLLDFRPAALRNPSQRAIFRLQASLCRGIRGFLEKEGFAEIHSPKLTAAGAEGGANEFSLEYFGKTAQLAQSPQVYKQLMVPVFERVYEIGPVFRAEKHDTSRHLLEYTSIDLEMGYISGFGDLMELEEEMLRETLNFLSGHNQQELDLLEVRLPEMESIPRIRFEAAKQLVSERFSRPIPDAKDLDPDEERLLCQIMEEETGSQFVFVTHYPSAARPFYAMDDPENPAYTLSFDLLFRGLEITTGGQRIHEYAQQVEKMQARGMDISQFSHYLMAHKYGTPPHGGMGIGLERLLMQLLGLSNIRMATLFPRDVSRLVP